MTQARATLTDVQELVVLPVPCGAIVKVSDNPYQSPASLTRPNMALRNDHWERLRRVAVYQKGVLFCILIYLAAIGAQFVLPEHWMFALRSIVVVDVIVGTMFVFLLSTQIYGLVVGVMLGLLTLVPYLGLFVLVLINGKANAVLRGNGFRVGLLGARRVQILAAEAADAEVLDGDGELPPA